MRERTDERAKLKDEVNLKKLSGSGFSIAASTGVGLESGTFASAAPSGPELERGSGFPKKIEIKEWVSVVYDQGRKKKKQKIGTSRDLRKFLAEQEYKVNGECVRFALELSPRKNSLGERSGNVLQSNGRSERRLGKTSANHCGTCKSSGAKASSQLLDSSEPDHSAENLL